MVETTPALPLPGAPFPFQREDLEQHRLATGVRATLAHFFHWRDSHPGRVASHVEQYTSQLEQIAADHRLPARVARRTVPGRRRAAERAQIAREAEYFGVYNLSEILTAPDLALVVDGVQPRLDTTRRIIRRLDERRGVPGIIESLADELPALRDAPETTWLAERLDRLHKSLPEPVLRSGGMGKVVRTLVGVLAIGAYDVRHADRAGQRTYLARVLPAAFAYGAAYVIVDDTLQDLPGDYLPAADRRRADRAIQHVLGTGDDADLAGLLDHPLADLAHELYGLLRRIYPFSEYRHLYHAAESMYLAQQRDAAHHPGRPPAGRLTSMYPDIFSKAGLTRVIANILARPELPDGFYARCLNTIFLSQLKDDLKDYREDARAGRLTPFTYPLDQLDTDPLYDLFAYDAYVVSEVFGDDPLAARALTYFGAGKLAFHLARDRAHADELIAWYRPTGEIARFLRIAAGLPGRLVRGLDSTDMALKERAGRVLADRDPATVECRAFVADRLPYLNSLMRRSGPGGDPELARIAAYAIAGSGKRLRPALTLMLAEILDPGTSYRPMEPLLAAGELLHTASLLFDDLPAQDDARMRRGRPAAHVVFDEGSVQLAALSMISAAFGMVSQLTAWFAADRVTEVVAYLGSVLGSARLCRGQQLDLRLARAGRPAADDIIEMYRLKTSTSIEAALVPLMMLRDRPAAEIALLQQYAHHAGVVFQIRDDLLDLTGSTDQTGKDAGHDTGKVNAVRAYGPAQAQRLLESHLARAVDHCDQLPFDAGLLAGMVRFFASRRR